MSIQLSAHFNWRGLTRDIPYDNVARALAGRRYETADGSELFYDPGTRTTVIVECNTVVTIYRMKKSVLKRRYSR